MDADAVEIRVLGSLIEKQRTTPDVYPLSLNALRLACNQATSRDPVVDYDEPTIRAALDRLARKGWTRLASGAGSRTAKYRHLLDEALRLDVGSLALLAVLMLRGPQTAGELRINTDRMPRFADISAVEGFLHELATRRDGALVVELPRTAGTRETRWAHLLGGAPTTTPPTTVEKIDETRGWQEEIDALRAELADLRARIDALEARD